MHKYHAVLLAISVICTVSHAQSASTPKLHWYRGNTHTHTVHADGDTSPETVARWYKEHGYAFVFITDHEYLTDVAPLNALLGATERFLVLPGQEVTQSIGTGQPRPAHVNALFSRQVTWPVGVRECLGKNVGACAPDSMSVAESFRINIAAIRAQGAIPQINHPNLFWAVRPEDLRDVPDGTLIEVWNGFGDINNLGGDDGKGDARPSAEGYWDGLLSQGKVLWGVAADDSHTEAQCGHAWIVVRAAELTPAAIRGAIEHGDFYASNGIELDDVNPNSDLLSVKIRDVKTSYGDTARYRTRFIGQGGTVLAEVAGTNPTYRFNGEETYVRASIIDSNGKRAWTQPVFRDYRSKRIK